MRNYEDVMTAATTSRRPKKAVTELRQAQVQLTGASGDLLRLQRAYGNRYVQRLLVEHAASDTETKVRLTESSSSGAKAIQRYVDKTDRDGNLWRASESGKSALFVQQAEGGQQLFATPNLVKQANAALAKAGKNGSFIRLKATPSRLEHGLPKGLSPSVRAVEPRLVTLGPDPGDQKLKRINNGLRADDDGATSHEFALWADCGRASRTVLGTSEAGSSPRAHVKIGGKETQTAASLDPAEFTRIYKVAMPEFIKAGPNQKYLKKNVHYDEVGAKRVIRSPADDQEAKKLYWALGVKGRQAFDRQTGVNLAANPEVGGAYTMATEPAMPGFKEQGPMTWNFHWAGVVMKDGTNNITLENYAVSYGTSPDPIKNQQLQQMAYDEVNRTWVFQMYGIKKKGQTFHEQHLASGTHGTRGSSFAVQVE